MHQFQEAHMTCAEMMSALKALNPNVMYARNTEGTIIGESRVVAGAFVPVVQTNPNGVWVVADRKMVVQWADVEPTEIEKVNQEFIRGLRVAAVIARDFC